MNRLLLSLAMAAVLAPAARATLITDNLLAWWNFEGGFSDTSGSGRDLALADNPGVVGGGLPTIVGGGVGGSQAMQSAPTLIDGRSGNEVASGYARHGNGTIDALDFAAPHVPGFPLAGFAVQAWINVEQLELAQSILFNRDIQTPNSQPPRNGWELHLGHRLTNPNNPNDPNVGKNQLQFIGRSGVGGESVGAIIDLSTSVWHHVVFSATPFVGRLYVDGIEVGAGSMFNPFEASAHDLFLGVVDANIFGVDLKIEPLKGMMDDVALWNRHLTSDEVQMLYGDGNGLNAPAGVPDGGSTALLVLAGIALLRWGRREKAVGR